MDPVEKPLDELLPIQLDLVSVDATLIEFKSYIDKYHYLGYGRSVGECMGYIARNKSGTALACLLFGSFVKSIFFILFYDLIFCSFKPFF